MAIGLLSSKISINILTSTSHKCCLRASTKLAEESWVAGCSTRELWNNFKLKYFQTLRNYHCQVSAGDQASLLDITISLVLDIEIIIKVNLELRSEMSLSLCLFAYTPPKFPTQNNATLQTQTKTQIQNIKSSYHWSLDSYYTELMPVLQHHEILLLVHLSPVLLQDRVHLLVLIVAETLPTWNPEMLISTYVD